MIDLPEGMPKQLLKHLKTVWVSGQRLQISKVKPGDAAASAVAGKRKPAKTRRKESPTEESPPSDTKSEDKSSPKSSVRQRPAK